MQLQEIRPRHKLKSRKRVGRGGKRGTYSGRGIKGQKARAGRKMQPVIRSFLKKYPKLRGYRFRSGIRNRELGIIVNLETLEKKFETGEKVSPQTLLEKRLIRRIKGKMPRVKILGGGELTKTLTIEECEVSKQAKDKIEKAHGRLVE